MHPTSQYNNFPQPSQQFKMQVNRTRVILQKSYHKILYLYPAINDTFVFLGMLGLRQDCITHMDKKGNVLFQHVFQKPMDSLGMLTQDQAITLQTRSNTITILNLKTHQFRRIPHHFFNQQSDQSTIYTFAQSKYLCIQQQGRYNDNRFKLSYYKLPLDQQSKPFSIYQAKDNEWTFEHQVKKANQHSMVAWFKPRCDEEWEWRTFDVRDNVKGKFKVYRFVQQVGLQYGLPKVEVAVNTLWEAQKDVFWLVCITSKTQQQANVNTGVVQNTFVCETQTGTIRQAEFAFGPHHDYQIDQYNIGGFSMFRTYDFQNGKALKSPIFYIDNTTQKIIHQQQWQCSYLNKYQFPGYDGNMLIQNMFQNSDCEWFECSTKKFWNFKASLLQLIMGLHEFDEDLLQQTMELLNNQEEPIRAEEKTETNVQ